MTPDALAALHVRAMTVPAPWSASDFAELLQDKTTFLVTSSLQKYAGEREGQSPSHSATTQSAQNLRAFALGRVILDEAELLTLAVDPKYQRLGHGRACLNRFETEASNRGATTLHLEVSATNSAAIALYRSSGWQETGQRKDYYKSPAGRTHANLMTKRLHLA